MKAYTDGEIYGKKNIKKNIKKWIKAKIVLEGKRLKPELEYMEIGKII